MFNRGFESGRTVGEAYGAVSSSETEWQLVGGRRRRRGKDSPPPLPFSGRESLGVARDANMEVVNYRTERRSPSWWQSKGRSPRPPVSSAVSINGRTEGFSYIAALKSARENIDLETLGIKETRVRKAVNGGFLIEVFGEDSRVKAEKLGMRIREVLRDSA